MGTAKETIVVYNDPTRSITVTEGEGNWVAAPKKNRTIAAAGQSIKDAIHNLLNRLDSKNDTYTPGDNFDYEVRK